MVDLTEIRELIQESQLFERKGLISLAYQKGQLALQKARSEGEKSLQALALTTLAYCELRLGRYPECKTLALEALDLDAEGEGHVEALLMLGGCAIETEELDAGEEYFYQAVQLSRKFGYDRLLLRGLHNLASGIYMPRGQFDLSLHADEYALRIAREKGLMELAYLPLVTLSWVNFIIHRDDIAREMLGELRQIALPGAMHEGYYYWLQGKLSLREGEHETGLKHFETAHMIAEANGAPDFISLTCLGLSQYHLETGNAASAYAWADNAVQIAKRLRYHHLQGMGLIERGRAAWKNGNRALAERDLREAIRILEPLQLNFELTRALLNLSALLYDLQSDEMDGVLLAGLKHAHDGGFTFLIESGRSFALPILAARLSSPLTELAQMCAIALDNLQRLPPLPMRVTMLGRFEVWLGPRQVEKRMLRQRRAGELLALLLLEPSFMLTFEQVAEALWPDRDIEAALIQFHHATSALRRALEPDLPEKFPSRYLHVEEGVVWLGAASREKWEVKIDYLAFERCYAKKEWEAALKLYPGELLPEYRYAAWAVVMRQRLTQHYEQVLLNLAEERLAAGVYQEAYEFCQSVLKLEPWQEQAVLLGMQALIGMKNRGGAIRLYKNLKKELGEELGLLPLDEIEELYRLLLKASRQR